jgi:hypothetical protein
MGLHYETINESVIPPLQNAAPTGDLLDRNEHAKSPPCSGARKPLADACFWRDHEARMKFA